ncbi:hypothetical protein RND81_01G156500 [Saponaria officinalis]|uniref:NAC domain-containing protein n=1 Tax=Saponaria officinalis TaxID=3572 RepID=A0AAW1N801_SAPOF
MGSNELELPPGFRFHPTDEELVMHYLCRKCASLSISVPIIAEIDLYKFDPWDLPQKALYGEKEWYFFSPRDRKYPNGSRPNRAAGTGYWKATGADKPIGKPKPVAIKKALVFYAGKAPKGEKTNWIMHEYRLADVDRSASRKTNNSLRLDDWVLCRIYNKKGCIEKQNGSVIKQETQTQMNSGYDLDFDLVDKKPEAIPPSFSEYMHIESPSDSMPPPPSTTSCSEHVVSPIDLTCEREVQSEPKSKWKDTAGLEKVVLDFPFNYMDNVNQMSPLQDMFLFLQRPF